MRYLKGLEGAFEREEKAFILGDDMQFYKGYTSKDYDKDGIEIIRSFVIDGKTYYQYAVELLDKVGRVIGFRATSKISGKRLS